MAALAAAVNVTASVVTPFRGTVTGVVRPFTVMPAGGAALRLTDPGAAFSAPESVRVTGVVVAPGETVIAAGSIAMLSVGIVGVEKLGCAALVTLALVALVAVTSKGNAEPAWGML